METPILPIGAGQPGATSLGGQYSMVQIPTWVQQHAHVQAPGGKAPGSNPPSSTALLGRRRGLVRTSTSVQIQVQIPAPALPTSPSRNPSIEWGQHCSFLMGG